MSNKTATTAQLGGEAQVAAPTAPPRPSNDPYSTADSHQFLARRAPRRTLDDMRKLSEEIKRARVLGR